MWREFKQFAMRSSVIDLAIGLMLGSAFNKIITSLVNDILMPPIGLVLGKVDFSNLYLNLSGQRYGSLAEAKAAGAATVNYGLFINTVIEFVIVAFALFLVVRQINRLQRAAEPAAPETKECPYCFSRIPIKATRCPYCTSSLEKTA
ncbi:MAG: large conductance mechanosensitive channel protein MscL [Anaerolineae bacterium]